MSDLPPSIRICEVLDGPYRGMVVRVGVRAAYIMVRDFDDATRPHARYRVVDVDGNEELRHAPLLLRPDGATGEENKH